MQDKPQSEKIFRSLIIIFILIFAYVLIPSAPSHNYIKRALLPLAAILGLVFFIQGIRLTSAARKEKGGLKLFLVLTGISAIALLPAGILHNLFYGLAITFKSIAYLFKVLSVASFIIGVVVAPIMFIVGAVGSIIILRGKTGEKEIVTK